MGRRAECVKSCFASSVSVKLTFRELSSVTLEPPMPVYLYNQVAGLRERNAKGYPVKKASSSPSVCSFNTLN